MNKLEWFGVLVYGIGFVLVIVLLLFQSTDYQAPVIQEAFEPTTLPSPLVVEAPEIVSIEGIELIVFEETNRERSKAGLQPLRLDERLSEIAREHSEDMAANNFYGHDNLLGDGPTERAKKYGYNTTKVREENGAVYVWEGIAENIGGTYTGEVEGMGFVRATPGAIGKALVKSWMESPLHKENILESEYDVIGVGVAFDGEKYLATQNFK